LKRYKYQLSLNQTADSPSVDERFENYSRIINTIAGERISEGMTRVIKYNNNEFNNVVIMEGEEKDKLKFYAIKIISKILKLKTDILQKQKQNFAKMSLIATHGGCTRDFVKIPDNLMVCLLTPLNRLAQYNELFLDNIINKLKEPNFNDKFLSNPSCYLRDTENSFLEFATTFYPGQMCNDIALSIGKDEFGKYGLGYYDFDSSNKLRRDNNIVASQSSVPIDQRTTLSKFIEDKRISGILFVTGCRSCDFDVSLINETQKIYILETFTNILNKTIDNPEYSKYNKCNFKTKYEQISDKSYYKARKLNTIKHSTLQPLQKASADIQMELKRRKNFNKSLSPVSPNTPITIEQYYKQILDNDDSISSAIKLILLSTSTDKIKYDTLNESYFSLNIIKDNRIHDPKKIVSLLFNIFNKSLENDEKATNYLVSYIFYIQSINDSRYFDLMLDSYQKDPLMKNITTLHLSGDIRTMNEIFHNIYLSRINTFKFLDISNNKNLMTLEFGLSLECFENLEKIDAHNCNILFVTKDILELNNLKEINLSENKKFSLKKTIFDNLGRNPNNYKTKEISYLTNFPDRNKMLSEDTLDVKYPLFLYQLVSNNSNLNNSNSNNSNSTNNSDSIGRGYSIERRYSNDNRPRKL